MAVFLLATESVHTTAAACDYLADRVDPTDTVVVFTAETPNLAARDAGDAANVARTRLVESTVETRTREVADGDPTTVAAAITSVAVEEAVDELLVGRTTGSFGAVEGGEEDTPGETLQAVLAAADRPVIVVPV